VYYFEEHPDLEGKLKILENYRMVRDITHNNVRRYQFEEDFVRYLEG
jgi:hypothetical protein